MIRGSIFILLVFFSCSQRTKVPEGILSPEKMEKLVFDMVRVDEFLNQRRLDSAVVDSFTRTSLYQTILAQHKISKEAFKKSLKFYESHPDLLKVVLDSMYSVANKNPEKNDSIKEPDLKSKILQKNKRPLPK